jgi:hypothetical protein
MKLYSKEDFLKAAEEGEVSMIDAEHVVSLLDEVRKPVPLTESNISALGFEHKKSYEHDQYHTNVFKKGFISVDFTYEEDELVDLEASISDCYVSVNFEKLKALNTILNG